MTRRAKQPKHGNRYTGAQMTAREAQTIVGCMRKLRKLLTDMEKRSVFVGVTSRIEDAHEMLLDAIMSGNRSSEL